MSYIANALAPHERLVMQARFPWLWHLAAWTALVVLGFAPTLWWIAAALTGGAPPALGVLAAVSGLIGLVIFSWLQLYMTFTETGVTDQRFIIKRGIVARYVTDFPLQALENIDVNQSILQRLFGFGRLGIAGAGETQMTTPPVQDPVTFRTAIAEARIALTDPPAYKARPVTIDPMRPTNNADMDERVQPGQTQAARRRGAPPRRGLRRKPGHKAGLSKRLR